MKISSILNPGSLKTKLYKYGEGGHNEKDFNQY